MFDERKEEFDEERHKELMGRLDEIIYQIRGAKSSLFHLWLVVAIVTFGIIFGLLPLNLH